jgi:hypothetical protein
MVVTLTVWTLSVVTVRDSGPVFVSSMVVTLTVWTLSVETVRDNGSVFVSFKL